MDDQIKRASFMNLRAAKLPYHRALYTDEFKLVVESQVSDSHKRLFGDICSGGYEIVFSSPEAIVHDLFWRKLLLQETVRNGLSAIVIDEAHCILEW